MDKINFILTRLHIDSSIFFQLGIFIFLYYFLKFSIFNKLKEVVVMREGSTTSLDHSANKRIQEAVNLERDYKDETLKIYKQAQDYFSEQRSIQLGETQKEMKVISTQYEDDFKAEKNKIRNEKIEAEQKILSKSETLSNDLINQIT